MLHVNGLIACFVVDQLLLAPSSDSESHHVTRKIVQT
jgi:hypothetical protein